jgi:hypothetical protein
MFQKRVEIGLIVVMTPGAILSHAAAMAMPPRATMPAAMTTAFLIELGQIVRHHFLAALCYLISCILNKTFRQIAAVPKPRRKRRGKDATLPLYLPDRAPATLAKLCNLV